MRENFINRWMGIDPPTLQMKMKKFAVHKEGIPDINGHIWDMKPLEKLISDYNKSETKLVIRLFTNVRDNKEYTYIDCGILNFINEEDCDITISDDYAINFILENEDNLSILFEYDGTYEDGKCIASEIKECSIMKNNYN